MKEFSQVHDSGKREEFSSGSVRDTREGKGRFDLIPYYPTFRLALHYENGAKKYGDCNWMKGQDLSRYLDSALRHLHKLNDNQTDEDHASAVVWNVFGYLWTLNEIENGRLDRKFDDLGRANIKEDNVKEERPTMPTTTNYPSDMKDAIDTLNIVSNNGRDAFHMVIPGVNTPIYNSTTEITLDQSGSLYPNLKLAALK